MQQWGENGPRSAQLITADKVLLVTPAAAEAAAKSSGSKKQWQQWQTQQW
jgi:hypothetical protein